MNNSSPAIPNSTDLVLQITGGDRDGQLLPVRTAKCLLSSLITDSVEAEKHRCAIFRGEKGVAFRSYSEHVLVNGARTSVQWLKENDTIQLTPQMMVVVKQLGTFAPAATPVASTTATPANQIANQVAASQTLPGENLASPPVVPVRAPAMTQAVDVDPVTLAAMAPVQPVAPVTQTPLPEPGAPVASMPGTPETPGQNVDQRLNSLTNRLSTLVDEASGATPAGSTAPVAPAPAPANAPTPSNEKQLPDASASIQDFLDNALASTGAGAVASPATPLPTPVRHPEATQELPIASVAPAPAPASAPVPATPPAPEAPKISPEIAAKLRKEEVTSSLNRLLAGTDSQVGTAPEQPSLNEITIVDQSNASTFGSTPVAPPMSVPAPAPITAPAATPSITENVVAEASVPKAQSLEFLKSLGIDAAGLGLDDTPQTPPATPSVEALRVETPSAAALPSAEEIIAAASAIPAAPGEVLAEAAVAPVEEPVAEPVKTESVADVLARMQNAGSLDSFSMDGPEETTPESVSVPEPAATPAPVTSEPVTEAQESKSSDDEDSSVEDYMSQLLNRMRGGEDSEVAEEKKPESKKTEKKIEEVVTERAASSEPAPPVETLKPEEFIPRQKAVRMKSFDSLREIANNSNRLAIQDHLANQRKVSTQTKLQLALISLGFGVLFFVMSFMFSQQVSTGGVVCGIAFLICGVVFAKYYRDEKKLDESIINEQGDKS